jgi:hypothetical protein
MRSGHLAALFGAATAFLRAPSAVIHRVLCALGAARFANFGADAANVVHETRTPAHECRRGPADVGAVAIQADAIGHLGDVSFAQASLRTVSAFLSAANARLDARLMLVMTHTYLRSKRSSLEGNVLKIPCRTIANPPIHTISATSRCPCSPTRGLRWTYRSPAEKPAAASN